MRGESRAKRSSGIPLALDDSPFRRTGKDARRVEHLDSAVGSQDHEMIRGSVEVLRIGTAADQNGVTVLRRLIDTILDGIRTRENHDGCGHGGHGQGAEYQEGTQESLHLDLLRFASGLAFVFDCLLYI